MITNKELQALKLSPTKQDYYQIWEELLDTAKKLSDRWDPTSTNESDPGIVLLKVLTAIADKLNYNIDKKILEAYMPTAAQEESMRRLCEILGYNMKYYQSATCATTITYSGSGTWGENGEESITIPKFTTLTDIDNEVSYVTLEEAVLQRSLKSKTVNCIEGQLVFCESDTNNIISLAQLDDQQKYYLPETQIAENGIFVSNLEDTNYTDWKKVDNLNIQKLGSKVFKFGYDSKELLPYIQFPEDISEIIEDGLVISYVRTSGVNGNISANKLSKLSKPSSWSSSASDFIKNLSEDDFTVNNVSESLGGANKETLRQAYMNYKKTVGTFDTLVTCRDYMNKIYQLFDDTNIPLVSNIIVSDIRDDINNSYILCSFDQYGICYTDTAVKDANDKTLINNFDLLLYPFKTVYGLNTLSEYKESFTYNSETVNSNFSALDEYKTISHVYKDPEKEDIACIKNYLKLNARITTNSKVNSIEESSILSNIRTALYARFNMRNVDFGDEIPFDDILECIQDADERIKNVALDEPVLYTRITLVNGYEYDSACLAVDLTNSTARKELVKTLSTTEKQAYSKIPDGSIGHIDDNRIAFLQAHQDKFKELYNKITLRNILAGRIALFNYNTNFESSFAEKAYPSWGPGETDKYAPVYPENDDLDIISISASCEINVDGLQSPDDSGEVVDDSNTENDVNVPVEEGAEDISTEPLVLLDNEVVQFRAQNYMTTITYPAYVNYYITLLGDSIEAVPATFISIKEYLQSRGQFEYDGNDKTKLFASLDPAEYGEHDAFKLTTDDDESPEHYYAEFVAEPQSGTQYYKIKLNDYESFSCWNKWVRTQTYGPESNKKTLNGLYRRAVQNDNYLPGYLVDTYNCKYVLLRGSLVTTTPETDYFVQKTNGSNDGLGKDGALCGIAKDEEYVLKSGEALYINYTKSASSADETTSATQTDQVINIKYGPGTIIKPNFELFDSLNDHYQNLTSWAKTTGFNTSWKLQGMFSFSSGQQVEIRQPVEVNLFDSTNTTSLNNYYVYWILNNEQLGNKFWEDGQNSRTLQDGEYFFYTDINKSDMAYYGSGCDVERIFTTAEFNLEKFDTNTKISAEDILAKGISVIPWEKVTLGNGKNIKIKEFQYVNLTKDCKLYEINLRGSSNNTLTSEWQRCIVDKKHNVKYEIDGEEYKLTILPTFEDINNNISGGWEARSKLDFNCGPNLAQTLTTSARATDKFTITERNDLGEETQVILEQQEDCPPISIKTNYTLQNSVGTIDTQIYEYDTDGNENQLNDFKLKTFENVGIFVSTDDANKKPVDKSTAFGSRWYKVYFSDFKSVDDKLVLNANFSQNKFGLFMLYYLANELEGEENKTGYIKFVNNEITPKIYNLASGWWDNAVADEKYYLRPGINVIEVSEKTEIQIYADTNNKDAIIFSELDVIDVLDDDLGINLDLLNYYKTTESTTAEQVLADINKYDPNHEFYYNIPVETSVAIDINSNLTGEDKETMATPRLLYDYNNVNNKFVISEIDADYLFSGITIAKSSKL